jgi:sortase B
MKKNSGLEKGVRKAEIANINSTDLVNNTRPENKGNKKKANNSNKIVKIVIGGVLAAGAIFFGVKLAMTLYAPKPKLTATMNTTTSSSETPASSVDESQIVMPTYSTKTVDPSAEGYVCPADFDYLQSVNDDIYAWLHIEGMYVDFPVCQSPNDDNFYLTYNSDGDYSAAGAIFTEHEFNTRDFDDPVTILYGHHMGSRVMFGDLQEDISEEEYWATNPVITIYMPDRELRYQVFAAVPYDDSHILYYHDFSDEYTYESFFNDIFSIYSDAARFHEEFAPEYGDKVIMLSTCLIGNHSRRFVVMGKLIYDSAGILV